MDLELISTGGGALGAAAAAVVGFFRYKAFKEKPKTPKANQADLDRLYTKIDRMEERINQHGQRIYELSEEIGELKKRKKK